MFGTDQKVIKAAIAQFPETFGLRAFPGKTFKIVEGACYVSEKEGVLLYTFVQLDTAPHWGAFVKGTVAELRREIVSTPRGGR